MSLGSNKFIKGRFCGFSCHINYIVWLSKFCYKEEKGSNPQIVINASIKNFLQKT